MGSLHGPELGESVLRGEFGGVASVDPRDKWVERVVDELLAEMGVDERLEAKVGGSYEGTVAPLGKQTKFCAQ